MLRTIHQRRIIVFLIPFVIIATILLWWVLRVQAAIYTLTVDSASDVVVNDAFCTLREAITVANTGIEANGCSYGGGGPVDPATNIFEIQFSTSLTIQLASPLPAITSTVDIRSGPFDTIIVEPASGVNIGVGFTLTERSANSAFNAGDSIIAGMIIRGFGVGVRVQNAGNVQIGLAAADPNFIYDNMTGIDVLGVRADGTTISNNYTGIDESFAPLGNSVDGISIRNQAENTTITQNFIGDNGRYGIYVSSVDTIVINNNVVGLAALASSPNFGNGEDGIRVEGSVNVTVSGNTVVNSGLDGISVRNSPNTLLELNSVGTLNGTGGLGNGRHGIFIRGSSGSQVTGGSGTGRVMYNTNAGVNVVTSRNVMIEGTIINNNGIGIDLGNNGVTANDASDGDSGPNGYQNYPEIFSAATDGASLFLNGRLRTTAGNYRIVYFISSACNPLGFGEGEAFLIDGATPFEPTISPGTFLQTLTGGTYTPLHYITAYAISASGNTSEFSACTQITDVTLIADFVPSATTIVAGQSVFFDNTSTGAIAVTRWYVDGVQVNTTYDLRRIFNTPGTYSVSLEIENAGGTIATPVGGPVTITVLAPTATPVPPPPPPPPPPVPSNTPTVTPVPSLTPIPTNTDIPTATASSTTIPSRTPIPTNTNIPTVTASATRVPSLTPIPTNTGTATLRPTRTDIPTVTASVTTTGTPDLLVTVDGNGVDAMSVVVVNAGLNAANNVVVQENLRSGVVYRAAIPGEPICTEVGGIVSCRLGTIDGGDSVGVRINVSTNGESPDSGVTIVTADGVVPQIIDEPYISKIGNPPVAPPGSEITYTIRVINPTTETATNMLIQDEMPDVIEILDASTTAGDLEIDGQNIRLTLDELEPGGRVILTIDALVSGDEDIVDSISNIACVSSSANPDPNCAEMTFLAVNILPETGQMTLMSTVLRWLLVIGLGTLIIAGGAMLFWRLRRQ